MSKYLVYNPVYFQHIQNPCILKNQKLRHIQNPVKHQQWDVWQKWLTATIVFQKLKLFSQYQLFIFSTFFNKSLSI